jgi:hypothetical protein
MLLWEMLTESLPFRGKNGIQVAMAVVNGERPELPRFTPGGLASLIRRCWSADADARPDFLTIYREFESKTAMFPGSRGEEVDQFSGYVADNSGHEQEKLSADLSSLADKSASPQTIRNFADLIDEDSAKKYFLDLNKQLDKADARKQAVLLEITCQVASKGRAYANAFVEANTLEHLKWDVAETIEHVHRLIYTIVAQNNKVFSSGIFLKMISNAQTAQPVMIIQAVAAYMQGFDRSSEYKGVLSAFLSAAATLTQNGGAPAYVQLICHMFANHKLECTQFTESLHVAIYYSLIANNPRAAHDIYIMYAKFSDVEWPMNDHILLAHLEIPQVRYALLSYLVRSYTPASPDFVEPLLKVVGEYPSLAGIVLCRMAKDPANARQFIVDDMAWLRGIHPLIGCRILFLIAMVPAVRASLAQILGVYTFLSSVASAHPELLLGVASLIAKFPICPEVANLLISSGLLEIVDQVGFGEGPGARAAMEILAIHAYFDKFALPRDFEAVIKFVEAKLWSTQTFTQYGFPVLYALSVHTDAQRVMADMNIAAALKAGDSSAYTRYIQAIEANCVPH